jgi:lipopolysaccharide/colanic/teichoic acid biosynthesis glycosyltransferase
VNNYIGWRESEGLAAGSVPAWKRVLDTVCILFAAPVLLPIGLVIALAIKLASPGPALFVQERVGLRGRLFRCLKFRTMEVNADTGMHQGYLQTLMTSDRPMTKLDGADKRLIPGGRILRCLGLDELPQIINVLRGEMSLVGPRPCLPYECELYQPRHRRRFGTLPGLTGLWQVNGKNRTTFEEMIKWDIRYVETKSPALDIAIMLRTFPAILVQARDTASAAKIQPFRSSPLRQAGF